MPRPSAGPAPTPLPPLFPHQALRRPLVVIAADTVVVRPRPLS